MKLTIDTKTDSKDEIRKAIRLLMGLVGGKEVFTNEIPEKQSQPNIFDSPEPSVGNMMSMFDTPESTETTEEPKEKAPEVQLF